MIQVISTPFLTTVTAVLGSSMISNQAVAGSIIVKNIKSKMVSYFPFSTYGPIKLVHTHFQGSITAVLSGSSPYFCLEVYHILVYVFPFQVSVASFYVSSYIRH